MTPSHITLEVPLDNGSTLSLRSEYQHFLKAGVAKLMTTKNCPPLSDKEMMRLVDTMISTCALEAAKDMPTAKGFLDDDDDKKEDKW